MKLSLNFFAVALLAIALSSCGGSATTTSSSNTGSVTKPAKYVFYFIGDGMAAPQVQLAEAALTSKTFQENYTALTGSTVTSLRLKEVDITGLATTNAANRYITCSAAAATALATGSKTDINIISQTPEGKNLTTIAQRAHQKGMKVGIVSSVSIDHATPACFYSHTADRNNYTDISDQLLTSGFDYFGGGSVKFDSRAYSEGVDKATAFNTYRERANTAGYKYVTTLEEFNALSSDEDSSVIATIDLLANKQYSGDGFALPYTINHSSIESEDDKISLADFTRKGIEILDGEEGFFMMVEGGKIDWACHANDAATCAYEVVAFDEAIGVALDFAAAHPDETLIVVTGDHDCGGLALGFAGTGYESAFELLSGAKMSYNLFAEGAITRIKAGESFDQLLAYACSEYGFTNKITDGSDGITSQSRELSDVEIKKLKEGYTKSRDKINNKGLDHSDRYAGGYGGYDPFTTICNHILNNKSGIDFASYSHTALPVMVFAKGANSDIFSGYYDNTDIAKKIAEAAALSSEKQLLPYF